MLSRDDFVVGLMDDITIGVPQEIGAKVSTFLEVEGPKVGFHPNWSKTLAFPPCSIKGMEMTAKIGDWNPRMSWVYPRDENGFKKEDCGIRQLGSYIGTKEYVEKQWRKKIDEKLKPIAKIIVLMRDPHCAWEAIKRLPAIIGLDFGFRTTPTDEMKGVCDYLDDQIKELFEVAVVGKRLSDLEWNFAQLPTPAGWGLTPAWIKSIAGYTASLNSNLDEIVLLRPDSEEFMKEKLESMKKVVESHLTENSAFKLTPSSKQGEIVKALMAKNELRFALHENQRIRVLYRQQNDKKAQAVRIGTIRPGMHMAPDEFQTFARRSLGVDLAPIPMECKECHGIIDVKADHDCMSGGSTVQRHNLVRDFIYETAHEGMIPCKREQEIGAFVKNRKDWKADLIFEDPIPNLTKRRTAADVTHFPPRLCAVISKHCRQARRRNG